MTFRRHFGASIAKACDSYKLTIVRDTVVFCIWFDDGFILPYVPLQWNMAGAEWLTECDNNFLRHRYFFPGLTNTFLLCSSSPILRHGGVWGELDEPAMHCEVATTAIRIRKWKFKCKQWAEFNSNVNNGGENVLWRMAPSSTSCLCIPESEKEIWVELYLKLWK